MIKEQENIVYDSNIDYVGFNLKAGKIISEKIYYKKASNQCEEFSTNPFLKKLLASVNDLRLFSAETYRADQGIIKYDFHVASRKCWRDSKRFLSANIAFYDRKLVKNIEKVSWLQDMFTTLSFRISDRKTVSNTVLYFRRPPTKRARLENQLVKLVPHSSAQQCNELMKQMFQRGAWIRLVAVDFSPSGKAIKIYFETDDPNHCSISIQNFLRNTCNFEIVTQILDYASSRNLLLRGIAIVMDVEDEELQYNLYFVQRQQRSVDMK